MVFRGRWWSCARSGLQALEPFRLPHIRRMCDVPIDVSFDPAELLASSGTIWMLGSESHQRQAAGVCTALTAAIVEVARELGRDAGRLRPPLLLALNEAVNVAPIPRLEQLLSTGGGSGIQTMVVLQSLAAARNAWGKELGDPLLDQQRQDRPRRTLRRRRPPGPVDPAWRARRTGPAAVARALVRVGSIRTSR